MTAPPDAKPSTGPAARISCDERLELHALPGLPMIEEGDDLAALISAGLTRAAITLRDGDILAVTSKVLSRAEGRFVDLRTVAVSEAAQRLATETGKDARLVELILRESTAVSRKARGVLVVRHRLGFITAHASIDCSNAVPVGAPADSGPWALLLPTDPDRDAEQIRSRLHAQSGAHVGVVITDSLGRPFRIGTVGAAIGVAGLPAIWDRRGETDIYGRKLEITITALADQVAAAADLVAGQASEGRAVVHIRGLKFQVGAHRADELYRRAGEDLYA